LGKINPIKSPSENLELNIIHDDNNITLELFQHKQSALKASVGRFLFNEECFQNGFVIDHVEYNSTDEHWHPVYGERNTIRNHYNELIIKLIDKVDSTKKLKLICRVYNEGIAFRHLFDSTNSNLVIKEELTVFQFNEDHEAWISKRSQSEIIKTRISDISFVCERPLVVKQNDKSYLALGEAALVDYARMKFKKNQEHAFSIQTQLDSEINLKQANFKTPWRYVMIAESPGALLENNHLILNLNEPNQIDDVSWIKPGKIIREVSLTTQGGMACIDFAANHNLQYVEFDAGWYGNEYDNKSDASTITVDPKRSPGPLDLHSIIEYANKKDIGIILYVNQRALERQLDDILPLYKSWGIKGLKYGFVHVGSQKWTSWLHEAVRKAAKHQLMVDIHDEYRPTGYSRTYPNLMTQEGIRGDEESPDSEHTLTTLFTRMIAGAGDNTNCYLASRVAEKMGGKTAQMAKAILLYSPWQFLYWYDRPEASSHEKGGAGSSTGILTDNMDLSFYDALPTTWDESLVVEGQIGAYATIARKKEDQWFIGSLTGEKERTVNIPLTFLDQEESYEATIYFQDAKGIQNNTIKITTIRVDTHTVIKRNLLQNSGLAVVIKKK
jgi:alpha-glucosidase